MPALLFPCVDAARLVTNELPDRAPMTANAARTRSQPGVSRCTVLYRAGLARVFAPRRRWVQITQLAAVILAGLLIRIAFIQSAGYRDDIIIFYGWFKSIAALPLAQVYAHTPGLNYPPMSVVLYKLEAIIMRWFMHGESSEHALNYAIKLPPILVDLAGAVLTYVIIRRYAAHAFALLGATFIALNPAIINDSAYWGQNDTIPTVLALFAISELLFGKTIVAWLSITAAVLFKPPVLVLVPLMLLHPFCGEVEQRRGRLRQTSLGVAGALIFAEIVALTFFAHPTPFVAARHLLGQIVGGSSYFPFNSLNAFNMWAIFQPFFITDQTKFLALSMHAWGDVIFILSAACVYWGYLKRRDSSAMLEASTLVLLAFFLFLTEMHERYLYYAVFFCGTLLFKKQYGWAALIISLTLLLNLEYGLTFMYLDDAKATMIDRYEFAPWLVHLCSVANIGVFVWLLTSFLKTRPAVRDGHIQPAEPMGS